MMRKWETRANLQLPSAVTDSPVAPGEADGMNFCHLGCSKSPQISQLMEGRAGCGAGDRHGTAGPPRAPAPSSVFSRAGDHFPTKTLGGFQRNGGGSAGAGILKDYFFPASLRFFEKKKVKKRGRKRKSYSSSSPRFPSWDHARPFATSSAFTSPDAVTQRDGDNPRVSPPAWGCPLHNHNPPHLPQPPVPKHKQPHLSP